MDRAARHNNDGSAWDATRRRAGIEIEEFP
jgi:hypothetical protein